MGSDAGLIWCWERGRQKAAEEPALAQRAIAGELVVLAWDGGVERKLKEERKRGTLFYLATLQGLQGVDLDISLDSQVEVVCTKTRQVVVFDPSHLARTQGGATRLSASTSSLTEV
jgi:hypothetical protein